MCGLRGGGGGRLGGLTDGFSNSHSTVSTLCVMGRDALSPASMWGALEGSAVVPDWLPRLLQGPNY